MTQEHGQFRFGDGKAPGAMRTIGEVCDALRLKPHVLRYWEQQFPMLNPLKRSGGRRLYRPEDVALVRRIDALVNREGYTIRGARSAIEGKPVDIDELHSDSPAPPPQSDQDLLGKLQAVRDKLARGLEV